MTDAQILDMPVKLGLEFMAGISPDLTNAKRRLFDDVIDRVDGIGLRVFVVDFQGANTSSAIDCRVLKTSNLFSLFAYESQELDVHLHVVPRDLFLTSFRMNLAHPGAARQAVQPMAANAGNGCVRHLDAVIALQIPNDPHWAEAVLAAKVQSLFLALGRRSIGVPLWDRRRILEPSFATFRIGLPPSLES